MRRWKNVMNHVITWMMVLGVTISGVVALVTPDVTVWAAEGEKLREREGLREETAVTPAEEHAEYYEARQKSSSAEEEYWKKFSNDYYYNQLSAEEKKMWDGLEASCLELIMGTGDAQFTGKIANGANLGKEDLTNLVFLFRYSNPQYYFLENRVWYASDYSYVYVELYDTFQDGTARAEATSSFREKIDEWVEQVSAGKYDEDKEKIAYDLLANNTVYESNDYDQSAYSLVCLGKSVCAGYTATMQMLLNAVGVETVTVTSTGHAWNLINLHDEWYAVDATWGDQNDKKTEGYFYGISYKYYNKSESSLKDSNTSHVMQTWWEKYAPELKYDSTMSTVFAYYKPYFTQGNYVYFMVNDNTNLDIRRAKVAEYLNSASEEDVPGTVTNEEKSYYVWAGPPEISISLDRTEGTVKVGETLTLTATVNRKNAVIVWDSSNMDIATVENGVVLGVGEGEVTITASYGTAEAKCKVVVEKAEKPGGSGESPSGGDENPTGGTPEENTGNEELVRAFVIRLYELVLEREAEESGIAAWTTVLLDKSSSGSDAGYGFVFSDECMERGLSDDEFVEILYNTFMNRPSDEGGKSAWVEQLEAGVEREKVLEGFILSQEFAGICEEYGISVGNPYDVEAFAEALNHYCNQNADLTRFVARCYTKALGREYDPLGLEAWCRAIIEKENSPKEVAQSFIFSEEFTKKKLNDEEYVKVLYRTFMNREADEGGLAGWVTVLESGAEDREKVLEGFSDSKEFAEILENFGLN